MLDNSISQNRFTYLTNLTGQTNWSIIGRFPSTSFLENWTDISNSPVSGYYALIQRPVFVVRLPVFVATAFFL